MLEETFAFALVIGCSVFGILWGVINILLVSFEFTTSHVLTISADQKS